MNQIDIPDYQYYLSYNAKRKVHLTFLEKKFVFQSELATYSLIIAYSIFKSLEFLLGEGFVQIRPNSAWSITNAVKAWNKKNFRYSLPRKKDSFPYANLRTSRLANFNYRSFWLGQDVIQSEPNSVWSIPCVCEMWNKKNFAIACVGKKVIFSYGSLRLFRKSNFENRSFWLGLRVVQNEQNSA